MYEIVAIVFRKSTKVKILDYIHKYILFPTLMSNDLGGLLNKSDFWTKTNFLFEKLKKSSVHIRKKFIFAVYMY